MRSPLSWRPGRWRVEKYDWTTATTWEFAPLDNTAFPAVDLARECGRAGGTAPAVFNAANEECVSAFLSGSLRFTGIVDTVAAVVSDHMDHGVIGRAGTLTLDDVLGAESWARDRVAELLGDQVSRDGSAC